MTSPPFLVAGVTTATVPTLGGFALAALALGLLVIALMRAA
jgi:hypothetical protein